MAITLGTAVFQVAGSRDSEFATIRITTGGAGITLATEPVAQLIGAAAGQIPTGFEVITLLGPTADAAGGAIGLAVHASFDPAAGTLDYLNAAGAATAPGAGAFSFDLLVRKTA